GHLRFSALVIDTRDQGVAKRTGVEFGLQHIVDGPGVQPLIRTGIGARQFRGIPDPAHAIDLFRLDLRIQIAEILPYRPGIVEAVLELVAEHLLGALEFLVIGLAFEETIGEITPVADRKSTRLNSSHVKISYA